MEPERSNPWDDIVNLPDNTTHFVANGKRYYVERDVTRLPLFRFQEYERKRIEWAFSADFSFIQGKHREAMKHCTPQGYQMAFTILFNLDLGALDIQAKKTLELMICTLFIAREGEDLTTWDNNLAFDKINDWHKEKLAVGFFLKFAVNTVGSLTNVLEQLFQEFSEIPENLKYSKERNESLEKLNRLNPYLGSSTT